MIINEVWRSRELSTAKMFTWYAHDMCAVYHISPVQSPCPLSKISHLQSDSPRLSLWIPTVFPWAVHGLLGGLPLGQLWQALLTRPHRGMDDLQEQLSWMRFRPTAAGWDDGMMGWWVIMSHDGYLGWEAADLWCMVIKDFTRCEIWEVKKRPSRTPVLCAGWRWRWRRSQAWWSSYPRRSCGSWRDTSRKNVPTTPFSGTVELQNHKDLKHLCLY